MTNSHAMLLISDSDALAKELGSHLAVLGHPPLVSCDRAAVPERLAQPPPSLVFWDVTSQAMTEDFPLVTQIRLHWRKPIVLLVKKLTRDITRLAALAESSSFLMVPLDVEEIGFQLENWARRRRESSPLHRLRAQLEKIDRCFPTLGMDHVANIHRLTALCGELLDGSMALYNRLQHDRLYAVGQWGTPPGFKTGETAQGHICHTVLQQHPHEVVYLPNLPGTPYAQSDPAIIAMGFKAYLGRAVHCGGVAAGTVCVLYNRDYQPTVDDLRILSILAAAIGNEDMRLLSAERDYQSQQMMRFIIDNIPQRVFWKDRQLRFLGCNQPFATDAGCLDPRDVAGKNDFDMAWKHMAESYRADDQWVIAHNQSRMNYEEQQTQTGGRSRWVRTCKAPLRNVNGEVIGVLGTYEDITERRLAEQALRLSEERYRLIVETAEEGIWMVDRAWRTTFVNRKLCEWLGWPASELQGKPLFNFLNQEGSALELEPSAVREQGNVISREVKFLRRDGKELWTLVSLSRMANEAGEFTGALLMATDITQRKQLEGQLRHSQKIEAMGQLAGGVAHDFNNILTSFIMNIYLLKKSTPLSGKAGALLADIENDARRAANLTRQLLLFSRRQPMEFKTVDLNETVANLLKMLGRLLGEHIAIEFKPVDQPLWIEADVGMIEQVIMNLCVNARDAMPQGGRLAITSQRKDIDIEMPLPNPEAHPGQFACLTVADTGCGMSQAMLKHMFEPFFTTKAEGTGLGLATAYGIVKHHHGWVEVESTLGIGTIFRVWIPLGNPATSADGTPAVSTMPMGGKETILLVEDEQVVRQSVKMCLQQNGYHIIEAENGDEALALWKKSRANVRLLFTDMVMPGGISGVDLANRLTQDQPKVKVIIGTGHSDVIARQGLPEKPGWSLLAKPYEPETLLAAIRQALDTK